MLQLLGDFIAQVVEAIQILFGVTDARFSFLAAFLVLRNAGGFFEVNTQLFRTRFDDVRNHALFDDRITARTQTRSQEQIGNVTATALAAVQVVRALTVKANGTLDRDFVEGAVLTRDRVIGVIKNQLHHRLIHRLTCR